MRIAKSVCFVLLLICVACKKSETNTAASALETIIQEYQDHEGYDLDEYPLGIYKQEYYQAEAELAKSYLDRLEAIDGSGLKETNQISLALLKFNFKIKSIFMSLSVI